MDKDPVSVLSTFIAPILKGCFLNYSIIVMIVTSSSLVYPERNGKNWICQVSALLFNNYNDLCEDCFF